MSEAEKISIDPRFEHFQKNRHILSNFPRNLMEGRNGGLEMAEEALKLASPGSPIYVQAQQRYDYLLRVNEAIAAVADGIDSSEVAEYRQLYSSAALNPDQADYDRLAELESKIIDAYYLLRQNYSDADIGAAGEPEILKN